MSTAESLSHAIPVETNPISNFRGIPSAFEKLITDQPPILQSLIAQLPTQSVLALYHTSSYLNNFLKNSPTSWRYISWRLYQPAATIATPTNNATGNGPRQSSNYALDQLLLYVINPFSTRLVSLELDNTAVGGSTLFQTVMILRKDTLEHVSVRGCKNVSLKYHINPWLIMHAMALDMPRQDRAPGYEKLALKSLYTYRCRHHRRRPYLPSSLARKESDSEPTHDLVFTCHKLGIWTDTAWCTTPASRCFRRRGYVTLRVPQDLREVWVVYDRLWRSRNWLGPVPENRSQTTTIPSNRKRKRDCRSWEFDEEAVNGESVTIKGEGKATPMHARKTHKQFVEDIYCDNCSEQIHERCEQCSVMMHCSGCRKTLCASCAFDRPYLRNKMAPEEDKNKFWWAPGYAVSPCSMLDPDAIPTVPIVGNALNQFNNALPTIKFRWCCTEPVFSGGGGITFGSGQGRDADRIRAAPLPSGDGWEDPEFSTTVPPSDVFGGRSRLQSPNSSRNPGSDTTDQIGAPLTRMDARGPGGRWSSIDSLFRRDPSLELDQPPSTVPRILCDTCYQSDQWKIKCKACSVALCLKHDVRDRLKVRLCGYKDLTVEKAEFRSRKKALKLITMLMMKRQKGKMKAIEEAEIVEMQNSALSGSIIETTVTTIDSELSGFETPRPTTTSRFPNVVEPAELSAIRGNLRTPVSDPEPTNRPISPGSNSTGPPSRASSPTPSARSVPATPEPSNSQKSNRTEIEHPVWRGCQSFFCPATRAPGVDHRRRCVAVMRQCAECKIYVCEQCTSSLEPPCPCKGCRVPSEASQGQAEVIGETPRFFCPNCRWLRMATGKCKRRIAFPKKDLKKKSNRRKDKIRKPVEERRGLQSGSSATTGEATVRDITDGLVEFFEGLHTNETDVTINGSAQAESSAGTQETSGEEIRELEDMGALARDLIRRIQTLRRQFGPTSLAALALPDIRVDDNGSVRQHLQPQQNTSTPVVEAQVEPEAQNDDVQASSSETGV